MSLQTISSLLQVAPDSLKWIFLPVILIPSFFIFKVTGNLLLAAFVNIVSIVVLTIIGFIPLWACLVFGIINFLYVIYSFQFREIGYSSNNGVLNVPNQLTQKRHDENKNQCPICAKIDTCLDYKVLKYADDCDMYQKKSYTMVTSKVEIKVSIDLESRLSKDLDAIKFNKGIRILTNLKTELNEVKNIFANSKVLNDKFIDIDKTKNITDEIYNKALNFLALALDIYKQTNTNCDSLKQETVELQESLDNLNIDITTNPDNKAYKILKSAIDSNNRILDLVKKNKDKIDELFGQISLCRDAITEIRLSLPELINHQSDDEVKELITTNRNNMQFGERLLAEFKKEGL